MLTAAVLLVERPAGVPVSLAAVGLALVGVAWAATMFLSVPCHTTLASGWDGDCHARLVATNWLRTACWTLRGSLTLAMTAVALARPAGGASP